MSNKSDNENKTSRKDKAISWITDKKEKAVNWAKAHKKPVIIASSMVAVVYGLIKKQHDTLDSTIDDSDKTLLDEDEDKESQYDPIISDISKNLTGTRLTATKLGNKVGLSAQQINKRLLNKGLMIKLWNNEYDLTEQGKLFGEKTMYKETRYGHSFNNCEWDEAVLKVIFSPEELEEIEARQKKIEEYRNKHKH